MSNAPVSNARIDRTRLAIGAALAVPIALALSCRGAPNATKPLPAGTAGDDAAVADATAEGASDAEADAIDAAEEDTFEDTPRDAGPYAFDFADARSVYVIAPTSRRRPQRLITFLHGMCNPPEYACGLWLDTGAQLGFVVCPTGDARCGPAQYNAPTWAKPEPKIEDDVERAIATTMEQFPGEISRDDEVLCGFSIGGYMAVHFAAAHPGRWPYLVINEANVSLSVPMLKKAQVRAVALIAGELGGQIQGERATAKALEAQGFPVKFWMMPQAGHYYSGNIGEIMQEAIEFVTSVPAAIPP